jgi:hypothetical protein
MSCRDPDNGKPYMDRNSVSCGCEIDSPRSCGSVTKSTMLTFRFTDFSPVYPG